MKHATSAALAATLAATPLMAQNPIDTIRPDAPALAPYGDFPVGVQERSFTVPGRVDIVNVTETATPTYDRSYTVEIWYPAAPGTQAGGTYETVIRDGQTATTLTGRAARDATPAEGRFPLVVISHGYPGNRFLMSHLGENLASKGYVTVSIDHADSTYSDQAAFGSTLYNRPWDQKAVIDHMAGLDGPLGAIADTDTTGVIGYSMGGYGALIFGGAGVTQQAVDYSWGTPRGLLAANQAGTDAHAGLMDARVKAIIAIGPWGKNMNFWDETGLAGLRKPTLMMAGSVDDVSVYPAMRQIFEQATGTDRHLLTFIGANHNAAAPIPAPAEAWEDTGVLDFMPFDHYADAVWDNVRMNNIAQHFATGFMNLHLKGDSNMARYFDLVEYAEEGKVSRNDAGEEKDDHNYWAGFAPRTAAGLRFETLNKGE
ncbi:dienelactone hydrolase [Lutimaribacter sp. EGI FJ00015]|uniref:Dienelactone hydrolase n=1 Tax=Lutimaribacter degradans TaxID=2945989 RepID=A0ACC5ZZT0_9RHOB|nr:dienelactone hydrolase [Lutimaribacter sp. EGI FJ00013]MCM2563842.1 dienelactone hydrolase [Lutimaribacter sp. EGI FJ00013]MCO0615003.1 dienelactone hydrolase [Lutimaribacter sp. EGI FJ00015]MCO0637667.1 dienelactone hydrolase [Lutimaribacter sp. EGI FJ00014]